MPLEPREWDSSFFGYAVASASWGPAPARPADIRSVLQEARRSGIRLLYLFMPPVDATLRAAIEQAGAKPAGRKVDYSKSVRMPESSDFGKDVALCRESSPRLEDLALQSGVSSRFRLDPGFQNREFERLYGEWLASSLRGDMGKRVYVAGTPAAPRGLMTLEPGSAARIGLLSVAADQRGKGVGRQLLAEAERFCCQTHRAELHVATQAENQGACRFYESCGFGVISETDVFHAWWMPP